MVGVLVITFRTSFMGSSVFVGSTSSSVIVGIIVFVSMSGEAPLQEDRTIITNNKPKPILFIISPENNYLNYCISSLNTKQDSLIIKGYKISLY